MIGRNIKVFEPVNLVKRIYALEHKSSSIMCPSKRQQKRRIPYLRLDTNAKNIRARRMYKALGYREIGIVDTTFNDIPGVELVLLEKMATIE